MEDGVLNTPTHNNSFRLTWDRLPKLQELLIKADLTQAGGQRPTHCHTAMTGQISLHIKMTRYLNCTNTPLNSTTNHFSLHIFPILLLFFTLSARSFKEI